MKEIILINISDFLDLDFNFNTILEVIINPEKILKIEYNTSLKRYRLYLTDGSSYVCNNDFNLCDFIEYIN